MIDSIDETEVSVASQVEQTEGTVPELVAGIEERLVIRSIKCTARTVGGGGIGKREICFG